jgi:hypothetical protein
MRTFLSPRMNGCGSCFTPKRATVEWCGTGTIEQFVVLKNLHRRHLSTGQRALIADWLATRTREETMTQNVPTHPIPTAVEYSTTGLSAVQAAET